MPLNDGDFAISQDLEKLSMHPAKVSSDVIEALALSRPTPIYPERAKANHVSGIVLVGATIGRDGRVHAMTIISAPDVDLAIAALAAVRQWKYKPYLLDGEPVEIRTQMTLHFNMSR